MLTPGRRCPSSTGTARPRSTPPAVLDVRWDAGRRRRTARLRAPGTSPGPCSSTSTRSRRAARARAAAIRCRRPTDFTAGDARGRGRRRPAGGRLRRRPGSTAAARAWWLLRYFGHPAVARARRRARPPGPPPACRSTAGLRRRPGAGRLRRRAPGGMPVLDAGGAGGSGRGGGVLLDARAPERFRGDTEPIDPVAGHIPGARNRPTPRQRRRRRPVPGCRGRLRAAFARSAPSPAPRSAPTAAPGVTAAHEVLALELAGVPAALYPGSWSEWITDPSRPVATGPVDRSARSSTTTGSVQPPRPRQRRASPAPPARGSS